MNAGTLPIATPLGPMALIWEDDKLVEILLEAPAASPAPSAVPAWVRDLAEQLTRYASASRTPLSAAHLAWDRVPPFHRQVYEKLLAVKAGETVSYGALAATCGRPKGARAVGQAMARNPWPILVPCHRVLATGGGLGGYSGGLSMKKRLLAHEGSR